MFGFGKNKNDNKKKNAAEKGKKPAASSSREQLIKEAMENAKKAREEIGEENIQKMAEELKKIQKEMDNKGSAGSSSTSTGEETVSSMDLNPDYNEMGSAEGRRAKKQIEEMDKRILASHLRDIIDEDKL
jgi:hypothetical protein